MQWELSGTNQTRTFRPGDLYIEEDHLAHNVSGRYGHVTRNLGDVPATFMMLQTAPPGTQWSVSRQRRGSVGRRPGTSSATRSRAPYGYHERVSRHARRAVYLGLRHTHSVGCDGKLAGGNYAGECVTKGGGVREPHTAHSVFIHTRVTPPHRSRT